MLQLQAMVEENRILRFRLAILEQQLRHASTAAAPASPTSARICSPVTPADPAAVASSGTGGASAGASEQTNSQVRTLPLLCTCADWPSLEAAAVFVPLC